MVNLLAMDVDLFQPASFVWWVLKGLYWILDAIQNAYEYLAGVKTIDNAEKGEFGDILTNNFTNPQVQKIFTTFAIIGLSLLVIFLAIGMIKACFVENDQLASRGKMVGKAFSSFLIVLLLPAIMFIGILACSVFLRLIQGVMAESLGGDSTMISNILHNICDQKGTIQNNWHLSWSDFKGKGAQDDYQYFLGLIAGGILLYVLIAICTSLVERLIEIIFFYLVAPFVLARTPLDDGGSFKLWKDIVIAKMLACAGIVISMYLYFLLLGNMTKMFNLSNATGGTKVAFALVQVFFVIGGAFAVKKGSLSIAQLVSQNTGVSEGMSQGQSMGMLSSGLRMGLGLASGALRGAMMVGQQGGSAGVSALRGATTGTGRANIPTNTNDGLAQAMNLSSNNGPASGGAGAMALNSSNSMGGNPYMPGPAGDVARANAYGGGGLRSAIMYGGIGGAVGYAGGSIVRGAGKVVKGAGRMLGNITGINARMQRHKEARAEKKNMNAQVKIAKKEAKDASRLAQGGSYNPTSTPKNAQQASKMADKSIRSALSADKKVANIEKGIAKAVAQNQKISEKYAKKYGSAGAQVSNVLNRDRLNKINQSVERLKRAGRETDISAIMARRGKGGKK